MPLNVPLCSTKTVPLAVAVMLTAAACGGDSDDATAEPPPAGKGTGAVDLSGACPETVVVQTQWLPTTSTEGALYTLLGDDTDIDTNRKRVTAPLISGGQNTGVKIELRAGGPALGYTPTSAQMYVDKSIHLGVLAGFDEGIQNSAKQPTLAVMSLMEKDPQMIFWDPQTYPDVHSIRDLGEAGIKVLYFGGDTYMEYLTGSGILDKGQVDGSGDGNPARFVAAGGKIASSGYATEDAYTYEKDVEDWGKPIESELVYDTGYPNYGPPLTIRPNDKGKLDNCLKKLVPVIQQAQVDFLDRPKPVIKRVVEIAERYKGGDPITEGSAAYGAEQLTKQGLVANDAAGKDETLGNFDTERVQRLIGITEPIFKMQNKPIKNGLKASDIVTNEFIDPEISLGR